MEELEDKNIYMMCNALKMEALSSLPQGYHVRSCKRDELALWKSFPFDDAQTANDYEQFMTDFFNATYAGKEDLFYRNTLFVCDSNDRPIATCMIWKAYDAFNSIHWLKVLKEYEGKGIGRALLSILMKDLKQEDYPIYLHTQPGSYRAIKLYSDFGFSLLSGKGFGLRENELEESLPYLEKHMPEKDFRQLKIEKAPEAFLRLLRTFTTVQF